MNAAHAEALLTLKAAETWRPGARNQEWGVHAAGPQRLDSLFCNLEKSIREMIERMNGGKLVMAPPRTGKSFASYVYFNRHHAKLQAK